MHKSRNLPRLAVSVAVVSLFTGGCLVETGPDTVSRIWTEATGFYVHRDYYNGQWSEIETDHQGRIIKVTPLYDPTHPPSN
jgi:hypothetical protein